MKKIIVSLLLVVSLCWQCALPALASVQVEERLSPMRTSTELQEENTPKSEEAPPSVQESTAPSAAPQPTAAPSQSSAPSAAPQPTATPSQGPAPSAVPQPTAAPSQSSAPSAVPQPTATPSQSSVPSAVPQPTDANTEVSSQPLDTPPEDVLPPEITPAQPEEEPLLPLGDSGAEDGEWNYYDLTKSEEALTAAEFFRDAKSLIPSRNQRARSAASPKQINNVVVFVNFKGRSEYMSAQRAGYATTNYNSKAPGSGTLADLSNRISYGQFSVNSALVGGNGSTATTSITLPQPIEYYLPKTATNLIGYDIKNGRNAREQELVGYVVGEVEATKALTAYDLDTDQDNVVDSISMVFPVQAMDSVGWGELLWPHQLRGGYGVGSINGKTVSNWVFVHAGSTSNGIFRPDGKGHRTVAHEFMHNVGLPDLYRYFANGDPVGYWDLMSSGNHDVTPPISSYSQRVYLRYGAPLQWVTKTSTITLTTEGYTNPQKPYSVVLKSPYSNNEIFVAELRATSSFAGAGTGLLVYRILQDKVSQGNVESNPAENKADFMYVFRPGDTGYNAGNSTAQKFAPLYAGNTYAGSDGSSWKTIGRPRGDASASYKNTLYYSDTTNSGIVINNIQWTPGASEITFTVTMPQGVNGAGTANDPYLIYTVEDLDLMRQNSGNTSKKYYKLMADLDFATTSNFKSLGSFTGELNGNYKRLVNLTMRSGNAENAGLFDSIEARGVVYDMTLEMVKLTGEGTGSAAPLCYSMGGIARNVSVRGGTVQAIERASGLVGYLIGSSAGNDYGRITGCFTNVTVSGKEAGGLVSVNGGGLIEKSAVAGKVTGTKSGAIYATEFLAGATAKALSHVYWDATTTQITKATANGQVAGAFGLKLSAPNIGMGKNGTPTITMYQSSAGAMAGVYSAVAPLKLLDTKTGAYTGLSAGTGTLEYTISPTITCKLVLSAKVTIGSGPVPTKTAAPTLTPVPTKTPVPAKNAEDFVKLVYTNFMGRTATAAEISSQGGALRKGTLTAAQFVVNLLNSDAFKGRKMTNSSFVPAAYQALLQRAGSTQEQKPWLDILANGMSRNYVVSSIMKSTEFANVCKAYNIKQGSYTSTEARDKSRDVTGFTARLYTKCLGRKAEEIDAPGLNHNVSALLDGSIKGSDLVVNFFSSAEFKKRRLSDESFVRTAYETIFDRSADPTGFATWMEMLDANMSRNAVLAGMFNSQEFQNLCKRYNILPGNYTSQEPRDQKLAVTAFTTRLYTKCLGRPKNGVDEKGLNDNVQALLTSNANGSQLAVNFFNSPEFLLRRVSDVDFVKIAYNTILDREVDAVGYATWTGLLAQGKSRNHVLSGMLHSQEFTQLCQKYGILRGDYIA